MTERDPLADERAFYDDTDYASIELDRANDVEVDRRPAPRSTFAIRLDGETIERLRRVAERRGTRPTQLARDWILSCLDHESADWITNSPSAADARSRSVRDPRVLEARVARLEAGFERLMSGSYGRKTAVSPTEDVDIVAELEAQVLFTRELFRHLTDRFSVEAVADAGADLIVRRGDRALLIQFKTGVVDLEPSVTQIARLAKRLKARPVLVSHQGARAGFETSSPTSDVLVISPSDIDRFLTEAEEYANRGRDEGRVASTSSGKSKTRREAAGKKDVSVVKDDRGWAVRVEGSQRALSRHASQKDALDAARVLAQKGSPEGVSNR